MRRNSVLVEGVRAIGSARGSGKSKRPRLTVTFAGGTTATLDSSDAREKVWAEVLTELRAAKRPAYIEMDPETRRITSLLLPRECTVVDILEVSRGGDMRVEFAESHAIHYLRRALAGFDEMRVVLENALRTRGRLLVTDSLDSTAILDVRTAN